MNKVDTGRSIGGTRGMRVALLVVVGLIAWPGTGRAQPLRSQSGGPTTKPAASPVGPVAPPRTATTTVATGGSRTRTGTTKGTASRTVARTTTRSVKKTTTTKKTKKATSSAKSKKKTTTTTARNGELGIELSAAERRIGVGLAASLQVKVLGTGGSATVNLTVEGAPAGVSTSFDSNPIRRYTDLRIGVGPTTPPGSYPLTVNAAAGEQIATSTFTLVVSTGPGGDEDGSTVGAGSGGINAPTPGLPVSPGASTVPGATTPPAGPTTTGIVRVLPTTVPGSPLPTSVVAGPAAQTTVPGATVPGATVPPTATVAVTTVAPPTVAPTTGAPTTTISGVFTIDSLPSTASVVPGGTALFALAIAGVPPSTVNYVPNGLPAGANMAFSITPTGATATLATALTTPVGTYAISITAASGNQIKVFSITLLVVTDFAIVPAAASVRVTAGNAANVTIAIVPVAAFASPVRLAVSGLPTSVTASISPNPVTPSAASAATLTLTTSSSTPAGTYVLQVAGTGGTWDKAVPVLLIVDAPAAATTTTVASTGDPSLTITPSAVTVRAGQSVSAQLTTAPPPGTTGQVTLAVSGAPAGIAVAITPNPSSGVATALVSVGTGTTPNTYALLITAIAANGRVKQATLTVVVTA